VASTYTPIASQTLTTTAANIEFTNIPGTYTDLVLILWFDKTQADTGSFFRVNGDTGSNYSTTDVRGNGSTASSGRDSSQTVGRYFRGLTNAASNNLAIIQFMSYANTNVYKTILTAGAIPSVGVERNVNLWRSTSAITSIDIRTNTSTYASGTTVALYGIKAAA